MPIPHPHLPALLRVLAATRTLAAQTTFYAAGLGAVALLGGANLPPELQFFAGAVGADILAGIITRLAQGESVPDDEAFLAFLGQVVRLLDGPEPPPAGDGCVWCRYRVAGRKSGH